MSDTITIGFDQIVPVALMIRALSLFLLALFCAAAQDFDYSASVLEDDGLLARAMPGIAERAIALDLNGDHSPADLDTSFACSWLRVVIRTRSRPFGGFETTRPLTQTRIPAR